MLYAPFCISFFRDFFSLPFRRLPVNNPSSVRCILKGSVLISDKAKFLTHRQSSSCTNKLCIDILTQCSACEQVRATGSSHFFTALSLLNERNAKLHCRHHRHTHNGRQKTTADIILQKLSTFSKDNGSWTFYFCMFLSRISCASVERGRCLGCDDGIVSLFCTIFPWIVFNDSWRDQIQWRIYDFSNSSNSHIDSSTSKWNG